MNEAMFNKFLEPEEEQTEANKTERQEPGFVMRTPDQRIAALEDQVERLITLLEKQAYQIKKLIQFSSVLSARITDTNSATKPETSTDTPNEKDMP